MGTNQKWEAFEKRANRTRDSPSRVRYLWQRIFRGYDDRDVWDLDDAITKFVKPRLDHFVTWQCEHGISCPEDLDPSSWLEILRKMQKAFDLMLDRVNGDEEVAPPYENKVMWEAWANKMTENDKAIAEGVVLFGKYLKDLFA